MSVVKHLVTLAAPIALLALGACATPFRADVARFQVMPAPQGQSFVIQAADPDNQGGLEFSQYAALVAQRLTAVGYQQAATPHDATLLVKLDYGVNDGREKIESTPGFGWGGWGGGWGGFGRYGYRDFYDPFWGPGWGWSGGWSGWGPSDIQSYTVYSSFLDMTISRTADNQRLFEGHAKADTTGDDLTRLVPNLVAAMFTGFPGRSGETVKINVPPPAPAPRAS